MADPSLRRHRPSLLLLAFPTLLAACVAYTPDTAPRWRDSPPPPPPAAPYRLGEGDLLAVKFYGNPELNEEVMVRPDGAISLPFVGDVPAAGMTPAELDRDLARRFTGELARPRVAVIVREFGNQRVFVAGEVAKPGLLPLRGPLTLFQAVAAAGGLLPTARRQQVVLIRTDAQGGRRGRSVDLRPVESGERPDLDVPLAPLDIVFVPRTRIASVDLFVEQYIRQLLPVNPGLGFAVGPRR
jgi:polysaccharide export outer membrane protein